MISSEVIPWDEVFCSENEEEWYAYRFTVEGEETLHYVPKSVENGEITLQKVESHEGEFQGIYIYGGLNFYHGSYQNYKRRKIEN